MSEEPVFGGEGWYLVYTKPQAEEQARENLTRQGYRTWLPFVRERKRVKGRYKTVVEPLFPRYLFVRLSAGLEDWSPIRSTLGVSTLVRFGTWPARVPDELVEAFRATMDETGICDLDAPPVAPGDRIRITEGVMAGYEGICQARNSGERVTIMLNAAGQFTSLMLPEGQVQRVE
ncbi:transcriptional antiterminator RfaH [Thiohalospira halophila DSM 15071]|uniref:Transcriptional antiterminator RfaH n=1 Tax=Thiohalospira halophila DSM 15071 TaxID=1123397 RepID=A0A1I1NDK4_9GAMM|nr:transcription/translation regulatory transformer protein RfaH [Thiohalospira halophila]SFC95709.1 transcriptional antiterminator RfaH [Thiohalospira halophila DSM 15071]